LDIHTYIIYLQQKYINKYDSSYLYMDFSFIPQYIQSWKYVSQLNETECLAITTELPNLSRHKIHLSGSTENTTFLDTYIQTIAQYYVENTTFSSNTEPSVPPFDIEYYVWNETTNDSYFEYNKDNKNTNSSPRFSIIVPWNIVSVNPCIVATNITLENYKYKEIPEDTTIVASSLSKNHHILVDGSIFCRLVSTCQDDIILKINVWNTKEGDKNTDKKYNANITIPEGVFTRNYAIRNETITESSFYTNFIFEEEPETIPIIENLVSKSSPIDLNADHPLILLTIDNKKKYDISKLAEMHGDEIAKDIFPFVNKETELEKENRFFRNKITQKVLSMDVCYWIMNETLKKKDWEQSSNKNYGLVTNVEKLPGVFNYIMYVSNFWLDHIKHLFSIPTLGFNIREIFIARYCNENPMIVPDEYNKDDTFLTMHIQLNDTLDFRHGGGIRFLDDPDEIVVHQGDMFIYNGLRPRTNGGITEGDKLVLVFLIDIVI